MFLTLPRPARAHFVPPRFAILLFALPTGYYSVHSRAHGDKHAGLSCCRRFPCFVKTILLCCIFVRICSAAGARLFKCCLLPVKNKKKKRKRNGLQLESSHIFDHRRHHKLQHVLGAERKIRRGITAKVRGDELGKAVVSA